MYSTVHCKSNLNSRITGAGSASAEGTGQIFQVEVRQTRDGPMERLLDGKLSKFHFGGIFRERGGGVRPEVGTKGVKVLTL
jgi:hypothetical protein